MSNIRTIKTFAKSFFRHKHTRDFVNEHVFYATQLQYELSLLINFYILRCYKNNQQPINIDNQTTLSQIRFILENRDHNDITMYLSKINNNFFTQSYKLWRSYRPNKLLFSNRVRSTCGDYISRDTITIYKNYYMLNVPKIIKRICRNYYSKQGIRSKEYNNYTYRIIKALENGNECPFNERVHTILWKACYCFLPKNINRVLNSTVIPKNWTHYIMPFCKAIEYFEKYNKTVTSEKEYKFRMFNVLPMYSSKAKYITLDTKVCYSLHKQVCKLHNIQNTYKTVTAYRHDFHNACKIIFNTKKLGYGSTTKLSGFIKTDGTSVSVCVEKPVTNSTQEQRLSLPDYINEEENVYIGLDPGIANIVYAIDTDGNTVRITNKEYHHHLGTKYRQWIAKETYKKANLWDSIKNRSSSKTTNLRNYVTFLKSCFETLQKEIQTNCKDMVKRRRMDMYNKKQIVLNKLTKKFLNAFHKENKKPVIAFGNGAFQSAMSGHKVSIYKRFRYELKKKCEVHMVDEFKTSKVCNYCNKEELENAKSRTGHKLHHIRICKNRRCRMSVINRDKIGSSICVKDYLES